MQTDGGPFRVNARRLHDSVHLHLPHHLRGGLGEDGLRDAAGVAKLLIVCVAGRRMHGVAALPVPKDAALVAASATAPLGLCPRRPPGVAAITTTDACTAWQRCLSRMGPLWQPRSTPAPLGPRPRRRRPAWRRARHENATPAAVFDSCSTWSTITAT